MNFSQRSNWSRQLNALTLALREKQATGAEIVDLTVSNPTRVGLVYPPGFWSAVEGAQARVYQLDPRGMQQAREAICAYYAERGTPVDPEKILITCSTSEAYALLFKLLVDPGQRVLVPRPGYPLFDYLAGLEHVDIGRYPLRYADGGWSIDLDRLAAAVDERTRAIVLVNPNNPTGSYISCQERRAVEALAAEFDLTIISDEVFYDYRLDGDGDVEKSAEFSFVGEGAGLFFALSGLSKVLALPQAKLGWIA